MIIHRIPHQSKLLIRDQLFIANYNSLGTRSGFDLSINLNQDRELFTVSTNTLYIWDKISFSANIAEEFYLESIVEQPKIYFNKALSGAPLNAGQMSLNKYSEGKEITNYFLSKSASEAVRITCKGRLKMTENLLGVDQIKLYVTCNIWQINDKEYIRNFELPNEKTFGEGIRK